MPSLPITKIFSSLHGKLAIIFLIITLAAVSVSTWSARYAHLEFARKQATEQEQHDLRLLSRDIKAQLSGVSRYLRLIRDLPQAKLLLQSRDKITQAHAKSDINNFFMSLAEHYRTFHQLRLLNSQGMEIVRVNYDGRQPYLVPDHDLQFKGKRYYFQEALKSPVDSIYISPMDLNVEAGEIEWPHVPVMRYATPIVDHHGHKIGVVVLNVFGTRLFDVLAKHQEKFPAHSESYFLLNEEGYFLFHPDAEKRFGFMFGLDERLDLYEPEFMSWVRDEIDRGTMISSMSAISQTTGKQTIFSFIKIPIHPENELSSQQSPTQNPQSSWLLISVVNESLLLEGMTRYTPRFIMTSLMLIMTCIVVAFFVSWSIARPVISLAKAARKIHDGDLSARATIFTHDEMGDFGNLFNNMATQLELSHKQLQASEEKYRHIFENSKDCIFVTDPSCHLLDLNQAGRDLFGLTDTTSLPDQLPISSCSRDDNDHSDLIDTIRKTGYVQDYETIVIRNDNSSRSCLLTASSRYDNSGTHIGYEGILRDVTEIMQRQEQERDFQKLLREEAFMAAEQERRTMGQALHEELAQNLATIQLKILEINESIQSGCRSCPSTLKETVASELHYSSELVSRMIKQIRTMIFELYPAIPDEYGLGPALHWYAENFLKRTGINVIVNEQVACDTLTATQRIYLFRAIKELLNNAWKHGQAKEVIITIAPRPHHFRFIVDDDGAGFAAASYFESSPVIRGIGLLTIREWINNLNGSFSIESEAGQGVRIIIDIPKESEES